MDNICVPDYKGKYRTTSGFSVYTYCAHRTCKLIKFAINYNNENCATVDIYSNCLNYFHREKLT